MKTKKYADYENPAVQSKALELTRGAKTREEMLHRIFKYIRDDIRFGYPAKGDLTTASETIALGLGQCNTKATLFLALCKALGIPARVHYSTIDKEIQHGLFPRWAFRRFPDQISHSWLEVEHNGRWVDIDAFINDKPFFEAGRGCLKAENRKLGYSIACGVDGAGIDLDLENAQFVQMDAVTGDAGVYDDPGEHFASGLYRNRPGMLVNLLYRFAIVFANRRVRKLRASGGCATVCC